MLRRGYDLELKHNPNNHLIIIISSAITTGITNGITFGIHVGNPIRIVVGIIKGVVVAALRAGLQWRGTGLVRPLLSVCGVPLQVSAVIVVASIHVAPLFTSVYPVKICSVNSNFV